MAALKTRITGVIRAPGDKSISHRALILSALAKGRSRITGILDSADVRSTAGVLQALGMRIPALTDDFVVEGGAPLGAPATPLDCGNSGTTARLVSGVIAGAGIRATLVGDASLSRRPMRRVAEPLRAMGATVELPAHGGLPMTMRGGALQSVEWVSPVASAQVKSAVLLAALVAGVRAVYREPQLSRDHTERMLRARGVRLTLRGDGTEVELTERQVVSPVDVRVPADPSSAAFWIALAVLSDDAELRLTEVCLNPTRTGFLEVLRRMGADIQVVDRRTEGGDEVGDVVARSSSLRATDVSPAEVPAMIDELPLFACVAVRAQGVSQVSGAAELRVKESDRIATLVANLRGIGADALELDDGFRITGAAQPLRGGVTTRGDHRIAMAFGILGALPGNQVQVDDRECVAVSYPGFWRELARVTT